MPSTAMQPSGGAVGRGPTDYKSEVPMRYGVFTFTRGSVPGLWYCPLPCEAGYSVNTDAARFLIDRVVSEAIQRGAIRSIGGGKCQVINSCGLGANWQGAGQVPA
jgi:hypothetical protein